MPELLQELPGRSSGQDSSGDEHAAVATSAERLGRVWLARYRLVEDSSKLPSEDPLHELILSLDFFLDLQEEDGSADPESDTASAPEAAGGAQEGTASTTESEKLITAVTTIGSHSDDQASAEGQEGSSAATPSPAVSRSKSTSPESELLQPIPEIIANELQYIRYFLPVFMQEVKQTLARSIRHDMDPPLTCSQLSEMPVGKFLEVQFSVGEKATVSDGSYRHGDLVLLYEPAYSTAESADSAEPKAVEPTDGAEDKTSPNKGADAETVADEHGMRENHRPRPEDVHCHAIGVVLQLSRGILTVRLLMPSAGHAAGKEDFEGGETSQCLNPATGRPEGSWRPSDRRRMRSMADALNARSTRWRVSRIMSLTTIHREFQDSLFLVPSGPVAKKRQVSMEDQLPNPLLDDECGGSPAAPGSSGEGHIKSPSGPGPTVAPKASSPQPLAKDDQRSGTNADSTAAPSRRDSHLFIPEALRARLEALYNPSQLSALEDSLKTRGVTLIQGPPGTGKTSTIVGVVSVILHAQFQGHETQETKLPPVEKRLCSSGSPTRSSSAASRSCAWLQPNYTPWMDEDEFELEDLDCRETFFPAAVPTEQPLVLERQRHALQPARLLVCAPSNAAIDEIVKRLTSDPKDGGGIFDASGERFTPKVVRVGANVHPELQQYSLEHKAMLRLTSSGRNLAQRTALAAAKAAVIRSSDIVCATISACGSRDLTAVVEEFDTVVIDEAAQAVELSTLIPLRLGCRRLILVGDPKQLPATIFSRLAINLNYDRSLFQRLEGAGHPTNMLSEQYRMHPAISRFASTYFYDKMLKDAPHLPSGLWTPFDSWHQLPILQPFVFFNLDTEHAEQHTSLVNLAEAKFVCQLVDVLRRLFDATGHSKWEGRLAVISPYAQQVSVIRKMLKALLGVSGITSCPIDVNTVDGFQGQEKDFVIFSAVRGVLSSNDNGRGTVGFLKDKRRLNVALTRGRVNLWLVANGCFLRKDKTWARLYSYARSNKALISINSKNAQSSHVLGRWLIKYYKKHPKGRKLLEHQAPKFLANLARDMQTFAKQMQVSKEDEEQGEELQTEGPVSWEKPIEETDDPEDDNPLFTYYGAVERASTEVTVTAIPEGGAEADGSTVADQVAQGTS